MIAGIDWVTGDHDPGERAVANISLGGRGTALNAAVAASIADGVTYVVAAGNLNADACTFTPAGTPEATTATAPLGRHTITITGTSAAGTHSASFALVVRVSTCLNPGQILPNPGFEEGVGNWTGTPGVIAQRPAEARSGTWNARFLGYEDEASEDMELSLNVPAGCGSYVLSFYLRTLTAEHWMEDIDGLALWARVGDIRWHHLGYWSNAGAAGGYVHVAIDVSIFAGQPVILSFSGWQDRSLPTTFSMDDVELNVY